MQIVIPMSGAGQRFLDAGYTIVKPLIEIDGKPMISHVIDLFKGENNFIFICNHEHLSSTNMEHVLHSIKPSSTIVSSHRVVNNDEKGPVVAVLQATDFIRDDDEVIVSYCDYGTSWNYNDFLYQARLYDSDGLIACYRGFHPHMLGTDNYAFVQENNGWLMQIQEKKPFTSDRMQEFASNGTYYFKNGAILKKYFHELVKRNLRVNNEFYVSMVYNLMIQDNLRIRIFEIEKMLQWGTPSDMTEYNRWSFFFRKHYHQLLETDTSPHHNIVLVLPMAGKGSRFTLDGYTLPKPLLPIDGLPMVIRAVQQLPSSIHKIFLCLQSNPDISKTLCHYFPNCEILSIDHVTEGQASSCQYALDHSSYPIYTDTPLLIAPCDNGMIYNKILYENLISDENVDVIVWAFSDHPSSQRNPDWYAWLDVDSNSLIKRVSVKKQFTDIKNIYAMTGTILFRKSCYFREGIAELYKQNIRVNNEFYVDSIISILLEKNLRCKMLPVNNYLCWGTPNDYRTYNYWSEYFIGNKKIF